MPNGYSEAMRVFTKILRPVFGHLRHTNSEHTILKIKNLLSDSSPSIRLASVIGSLISLFPAIPFGKFYSWNLGNEKAEFLKNSTWNFEVKVCISTFAIDELKWGLHAIQIAINNINILQTYFEINTDASECGWGTTDGVNPFWGIWSTPDKANYINFLELLAIKHALVNYRKMWGNSHHIRVKSENTTAIAYVNNMGGIVLKPCNQLAREIWGICNVSNVWLTAVHIHGKDNITADFMSRLPNEKTEWRLSSAIFHKILRVFYCKPEIDLFASCLNHQVPMCHGTLIRMQ